MIETMQQEVQVRGSRWAEEIPERWRQRKGEDRTEMKKEAEIIKVHLAQRISVEHREEIHEKIQRNVRHFPWY